MTVIKVHLDKRSYPVVIGTNTLHRLGRLAKKQISQGRVFIIYDAQVFALYSESLNAVFDELGVDVIETNLPEGERAKSDRVARRLYEWLITNQVSRDDFILACGGGVTSDLTGYVAATILRGVSWGVASTTLLGMVDAAIGGKTGINHRKGKNLVGAFWQPSFVVCDMGFLPTLSHRQMLAGMGETVKYAGLIGETMIGVVKRHLASEDMYNSMTLSRLVRMSVRYKASIVSQDEREERRRMVLNLGHTFAHALEHAVGYGKLLHGETVILGLYAAAELSCLLKPARVKNLVAYKTILRRLIAMLPRRKVQKERLLEAMALDKKRTGQKLKFVLLDRPGKPFITSDVPMELIEKSADKMLKVYSSEGGSIASNSGY
jgi:3-dehydroquinate synthase